jgi:hypothetical protein
MKDFNGFTYSIAENTLFITKATYNGPWSVRGEAFGPFVVLRDFETDITTSIRILGVKQLYQILSELLEEQGE